MFRYRDREVEKTKVLLLRRPPIASYTAHPEAVSLDMSRPYQPEAFRATDSVNRPVEMPGYFSPAVRRTLTEIDYEHELERSARRRHRPSTNLTEKIFPPQRRYPIRSFDSLTGEIQFEPPPRFVDLESSCEEASIKSSDSSCSGNWENW